MRFGLGLAAAMALLLCESAQAQAPATPVKLSLGYDGRLFIKVLDVRFDEQATPTDFGAAASLRSYGLLALFNRFDVRATSHGQIEDGAARPGSFLYENNDGRRDRKVEVAWRPGEVIASSSPKFGDLGHPPATPAQKLASADPLTQLMRMTMAQGPDQVCHGAPLLFDGKQLYALEFDRGEAVEPTADQRALGLTSLVRCSVTYREIAGFKPPKKHDTGLRSRIGATFGQFGPDGPWAIVKVSAKTLLGPAVIELKHAQVSRDAHLAEE